jgi:O-antigen/teichoic acid export membrane protein
MSEARAVLKHSRIYAAAAVLNRAAAFLIIPIHTRYLPESDYGTIGVITVVSEVVGAMFGLKLGAAMSRMYFDYQDAAERDSVVTSAILGAFMIVGFILGPLVLLSEPIAKLILGVDGLGGVLLLGVAGLLLNTIFNLGLQYFLIRQRSGLFLVAGTVRSILYIAAAFLFVAFLGMGLKGAILGIFAANAVAAAGVVVPLLWKLGLRYSWTKVRDTLRFGAPLIPGQVAEIGASFTERYLIVHMASLAAAGVYFLAMRLASVINALIIGPFNRIYVVRRFEAYGAGTEDGDSSRVFTYFFIVVTWIALGLAVLAREVVAIAAHGRYQGAVEVIPLACLTQVLVSVLIIAELGIYYAKIPRHLTTANIATLVVQLGLNLLLIPDFGTRGAVTALTVATAFRLALTVYLARGLGGPRIEWPSLAGIIVGAAGVFAICAALDLREGWLSTLAKVVLLGLYPLAVFASPLLTGQERRALMRLLTSRWNRLARASMKGGSVEP